MSEELETKWQAVVAKAEADEGYKQRLLDNTLQVLIDEGWDVSDWSGAEVRLNEQGRLSLMKIDEKARELNEDEVDGITGGSLEIRYGLYEGYDSPML